MMLPDVIAFTENNGHGQAEVCCAAGDVQWTAKSGAVVELPTIADIEYAADQRSTTLRRDDTRPIVIGRDTPTNEQLAMAEAAGELIPETVPDVFGGELVQPHAGHRMLDVDAKGRV